MSARSPVGGGDHRGLVDQQQGVLGDGERAAGAALTRQVTQELGGVVDSATPAPVLRADCEGVIPTTGRPAAA